MNNNAIEQFINAVKEPEYETNTTYSAIVSRVDSEGVVWVNLAGSEKETPTASTAADVKTGDVVTVQWRNNKLYIAGNYSNPSAGVTRVVYVERQAEKAKNTANKAVAKAGEAVTQASEAKENASEAVIKANGSVASDTIHYLATSASSGVTINTQGWTTTIQTIDSQKRYLWTYHTYTKAGGAVVNTQPVIIGRYGQDGSDGQDGANGISVTAVQPQYALSTSTSTAPTSGWGNTLVYEAGKYIWTRDAITYSNGNTGYSTAIYNSALTSACVNAFSALQIAEGTNQYFWHTETGTDTGAHITEIPKDDFIDDPSNGGGNLLARSNGIAVRDGLAELAVFGADSSQIGQTGKSHVKIDYHSLQMVDGDTSPHVFFHISDLRDKNNEYRYTEKFTGTGYTTRFSLSYSAKRDKELSVTVSDGSGGNAYLDSSNAYWLRFKTAPTNGATITVSYITNSYYTKAYTLGMRKNNSDIGPLSTCFGLNNVASGSRSFAEGWNTEATGDSSHSEGYGSKAYGLESHAEGDSSIASGNYSHAEGDNSIASGSRSHAEGSSTASGEYAHSEGDETEARGSRSHAQNSNTIAGYSSQTVIGKYNKNQSDTAFEIGNGTSSARSNALTVDWDGNVEAAGEITGATVDVPISVSRSTGTLVSANAYRYGKIVNLQITVYNTASVAAGSNIFVGQINTTKLIPAAVASGSSYWGSHSVGGAISATGQIVVRNASPTAFATSASQPINMSFMYMID